MGLIFQGLSHFNVGTLNNKTRHVYYIIIYCRFYKYDLSFLRLCAQYKIIHRTLIHKNTNGISQAYEFPSGKERVNIICALKIKCLVIRVMKR